MSSLFSISIFQSALELGCIYALVALALFISFTILNIADLTTDGCFTLGCAVGAMVIHSLLFLQRLYLVFWLDFAQHFYRPSWELNQFLQEL